MRLNRAFEWKVITVGISRELLLFNFVHLDKLCVWIRLPWEKLGPFEFLESFHCLIMGIWYIVRLNRTSVWKVMTISISRELPLFNFELLDILCSWIRPPCVKLWPFAFLESFRCSMSSVSICDVPKSDSRVKTYDHLNFSKASVVKFRTSRYIMRRNKTSVWKVMTICISRELPLFNFERLDI